MVLSLDFFEFFLLISGVIKGLWGREKQEVVFAEHVYQSGLGGRELVRLPPIYLEFSPPPISILPNLTLVSFLFKNAPDKERELRREMCIR